VRARWRVLQPSGKKRKVSTQSEPLSSPLNSSSEKVTQLEGTLRVEGDVRARAFIQYSDLRLKTDVASLVDALNVIEKLEPKSYKWLPNAPGLPALQDDTGTTHSYRHSRACNHAQHECTCSSRYRVIGRVQGMMAPADAA
jgi:hypothetical protein